MRPSMRRLLLLQADILARQERNREAIDAHARHLAPADLGGVRARAARLSMAASSRTTAAAEADFVAAMESGRTRAPRAAPTWQRAGLSGAAPQGRRRGAQVVPDGDRARPIECRTLRRCRICREQAGAEPRRVGMFSKAVDEWHAAPADKKPFDDTRSLACAARSTTLSRRWGATFSLGHRHARDGGPRRRRRRARHPGRRGGVLYARNASATATAHTAGLREHVPGPVGERRRLRHRYGLAGRRPRPALQAAAGVQPDSRRRAPPRDRRSRRG